MKYLVLIFSLLPFNLFAQASVCFGTTSNGHLVNGVQLPDDGNNFTGYSTIARLAGRTYVHSVVREIILGTYKTLETEQGGKVYKYAETGFKAGGKFKPHKTHRNGLSVDFMVPVINEKNESVHLPTHPLNRFGYSIEFDAYGRYETLTIDMKQCRHILFFYIKMRNDLDMIYGV